MHLLRRFAANNGAHLTTHCRRGDVEPRSTIARHRLDRHFLHRQSIVPVVNVGASMKSFVRVLLCLSLSVFAIRAVSPAKTPNATAKTAQKKETGQKADAKTLLHDARKATAAMIKNARSDTVLDPKKPKNKPF